MADESQEQKKRKKPYYRKWTARTLALYLMSVDVKYALPSTTSDQVMKDVPKLYIGINRLNKLRNSDEFRETVNELFVKDILSKFSTEAMFCYYLKHTYDKNIAMDKPTTKLLDVLGVLSGKYNPTHIKAENPKGKDRKMTPAQVARAIHEKEQLEKLLAAPNNMETDEPTKGDGEDGNE